MGSSLKSKSTRARRARSVKRSSPSRRRAAGRLPAETKPCTPAAIEIAIDDQRESIETAISLCYVLHSTLRYQVDGARTVESEAVENASKSANLPNISAMLLVRLDSIHAALDPTELEQVKVDQERLRLSEMAREMFDGDEREAS